MTSQTEETDLVDTVENSISLLSLTLATALNPLFNKTGKIKDHSKERLYMYIQTFLHSFGESFDFLFFGADKFSILSIKVSISYIYELSSSTLLFSSMRHPNHIEVSIFAMDSSSLCVSMSNAYILYFLLPILCIMLTNY